MYNNTCRLPFITINSPPLLFFSSLLPHLPP